MNEKYNVEYYQFYVNIFWFWVVISGFKTSIISFQGIFFSSLLILRPQEWIEFSREISLQSTSLVPNFVNELVAFPFDTFLTRVKFVVLQMSLDAWCHLW